MVLSGLFMDFIFLNSTFKELKFDDASNPERNYLILLLKFYLFVYQYDFYFKFVVIFYNIISYDKVLTIKS